MLGLTLLLYLLGGHACYWLYSNVQATLILEDKEIAALSQRTHTMTLWTCVALWPLCELYTIITMNVNEEK